MSLLERLADVLAEFMRHPEYPYTPGLLAKRSGAPKATIVNWLEGRRWMTRAGAEPRRRGPARGARRAYTTNRSR